MGCGEVVRRRRSAPWAPCSSETGWQAPRVSPPASARTRPCPTADPAERETRRPHRNPPLGGFLPILTFFNRLLRRSLRARAPHHATACRARATGEGNSKPGEPIEASTEHPVGAVEQTGTDLADNDRLRLGPRPPIPTADRTVNRRFAPWRRKTGNKPTKGTGNR